MRTLVPLFREIYECGLYLSLSNYRNTPEAYEMGKISNGGSAGGLH